MEDRVCLVTGGSRGIGAGIARDLAGAGHRVAISARGTEELERTARELPGPALAVPADVTRQDDVERMFSTVEESFGPVDVLVVNAGSAASARLDKTSDEVWEHLLAVHMTAPFRCLRRVIPGMRKRGFGRVVVIASVASKIGSRYLSGYSAAKHGVLGLVRSAAAELAGTGVTVNAVCPGYVDTPMTDGSVAAIVEHTGRTPEQARQAIADMQPIRRLIQVDEVVQVVRMLVDDTGAITGQGINVDGGAAQS